MILLDANYILRFLLKDNLDMYKISKECITNNSCLISNEVLAEVVFVLLKVYNEISQTLINFLNYDNIVNDNKTTIINSLKIFADKNLDFVDCILCAKSGKYTIKTFDKQLSKCIENIKI